MTPQLYQYNHTAVTGWFGPQALSGHHTEFKHPIKQIQTEWSTVSNPYVDQTTYRWGASQNLS